MKQQVFKVGDLVRLSANARNTNGVNYPVGAVLRVSGATQHSWGQNLRLSGSGYDQLCSARGLKLAKHAMKKRDLYADRRG